MFSSISRAGRSGGVSPASTSAAARRTQATISAASPSASAAVIWASQMRTSTVPKSWCGRTDHHSCVNSTIEPVRTSSSDVVRPGLPGAEHVRDPAARERLGERLGAPGVQAGVAAVDVGRVGADGQQQRQHGAQPVAHAHGAVGALHADVDVQRERVVAPGDVLQPLLDAVVVVGVDDVLLAVVAERVRAGRAERDAVVAREREQPAAGVGLAAARVVDVAARARADLDLRRDQLAGDRRRRAPGRRPRRRAAARSAGRAAASRGRPARTPPRSRP